MKLRLFVLFFLILSTYLSEKALSASRFREITSATDSLITMETPDHARLDRLLKMIQRLNWNQYYEEFQEQGPVKNLMDYCQKQKISLGVITCTNCFGIMYRQIGKPQDAERLHRAALELAKSANDTLSIAISLNNLGVNSRRIDDLKKATDFHMEVLTLAEKTKDQSGSLRKSKCIALNSLGNINISLKQYHKAIEIFKQSNAIEKTMNSAIGQAVNLANIGEAFELSGQIDSARHYYEQSLSFNEKAKSVLGIGLCKNNLGKICLKKRQNDQALSYFEQSIQLIRSTGDKYHLIISMENAALVWIEKQNYPKASALLDEALRLSKEINAKVLLKDGYLMMARIRQHEGDFQGALNYQTISHQYSDSIFNDENQRHLNDIQTKYETVQKEQQIILLNKEHQLNIQSMRLQRILLWGLSFLSLLILAVILLLNNQKKIQSKTREIELSQKLLRSQMNPHFIFNSLGAIQNFMMKNDSRKAAFYLSSFSSLMRSTLKNSREEIITLQEEKETIENFLNLHQLRLGEKLSFNVTVSDELDEESTLLPPMLVQPFVENAILHGIEKKEANGRIEIAFSKEADQLKITVDDDGPGFGSSDPNGTHVSYALQIFKERVANLKKTSGAEINYHIGPRKQSGELNPGTLVTVMLPLKFT